MADAERAAHVALLLSIIIAGLALAFAAVAYAMNPASIGADALRAVAIALAAILTARGVRWARLLMIVLTGFAAAYAVLTAFSRSLPFWGKVWFYVYGAGTLVCLVLLFVAPAAAHFSRTPETPGGA